MTSSISSTNDNHDLQVYDDTSKTDEINNNEPDDTWTEQEKLLVDKMRKT